MSWVHIYKVVNVTFAKHLLQVHQTRWNTCISVCFLFLCLSWYLQLLYICCQCLCIMLLLHLITICFVLLNVAFTPHPCDDYVITWVWCLMLIGVFLLVYGVTYQIVGDIQVWINCMVVMFGLMIGTQRGSETSLLWHTTLNKCRLLNTSLSVCVDGILLINLQWRHPLSSFAPTTNYRGYPVRCASVPLGTRNCTHLDITSILQVILMSDACQ